MPKNVVGELRLSYFIFRYEMTQMSSRITRIGSDDKPLPLAVNYFMTADRRPLHNGDTAAAVPPPFRLGDPILCSSHPLVTP